MIDVGTFYENSEPIVSMVQSVSLSNETFRLDGQFYILFDNPANVTYKVSKYKTLQKCCSEIYEVPLFKHIYVEEGEGVPFYTSSGLFEADLTPSHYLSPLIPNLERYRIKKGQILMARSGNVEAGILGQIIMAGNFLHNKTTSDHIIRFTPNENEIHQGYLCAFLMSDWCRGELLKNAAGAVIPAIRPESLSEIKIPFPENIIQSAIGDKILLAVSLREQANEQLNEANHLIHEYNHLPPLNISDAEYYDKGKEIQTRILKSSTISGEYRLDAHFYNPIAELAIKNVIRYSSRNKPLRELTSDVFMGDRFARNYVSDNYGLPFLSGKHLIQIRPETKFISISETNDIDGLRVKKGWILITRSGTLGRVGFIWNNYETYTATEDVIRVVPLESEIDNGYLYAFLSSEYGYQQIIRYKHGAVVDHIAPEQVDLVLVPIPKSPQQQEIIGDKVRLAYEKRAEAIRLEDEAQDILKQSLAG